MISKKMQKALNGQMQKEFYAASLYLSISAWCVNQGLTGFANWFRVQSMEEMTHAMKIYDYVLGQGSQALVPSLEEPPHEFESAEHAFQASLDHERKVTGWINELVDQAIEEKDHATRNFLSWYVDEQVEEEASAMENLQKCKLVGGKVQGLFMLDRELAQRKFTPPATSKE